MKTLPPCIGELENLHTLCIAENLLTELPEAVFGIVSLRRLDAAFNRLGALPLLDAPLPPLVELVLHHNQLAKVPPGVLACRSLLALSLDWNPFESPLVADVVQNEGSMALVHQHRLDQARKRASSAVNSRQGSPRGSDDEDAQRSMKRHFDAGFFDLDAAQFDARRSLSAADRQSAMAVNQNVG